MKYTFKILAVFFAGLILLCGCNRRGKAGPAPGPPVSGADTVSSSQSPSGSQSPATVKINVYIENSGSMDGYVNGNTEFKGAIRDLLVIMKHLYGNDKNDNIKIFYINDKIHEIPAARIGNDLASFASSINVSTYRVGNTGSTNLNNVFKLILDKTDDKTVSVLFSDCIYSISGSATVGLLSNQKSLTKDAFLTKSKTSGINLTTIIVKMMSKFYGTYYDKNYRGPADIGKHSTQLNGEQRPYYICVIGERDTLAGFNRKIELKHGKIEGFDNKYTLSSGDAQDIYYSVLVSTYNEGRFKPLRTHRNNEYVRGIESVNLPRGVPQLTFAIAVNFGSLPVEDDYIGNPANYVVPTDNFTVKEILRADRNQIKPSDWNRIAHANPTHIIILEAKKRVVSNVSLVLKKQMPEWIERSSTEDDTDIKQCLDKTFGFKYLVEGISEAYQMIYPNDKNFFECLIQIQN